MDIVNNPHDKFFKQVLGDSETAGDFLRNYLPQKMLADIELESLEIQKDTCSLTFGRKRRFKL